MPRKTRKQKEKANLHRQKGLAQKGAEGSPLGAVNREFEFRPEGFDLKNSKNSHAIKVDKSRQIEGSTHVSADLLKTLVTALGIASLEAVIYWAWFK